MRRITCAQELACVVDALACACKRLMRLRDRERHSVIQAMYQERWNVTEEVYRLYNAALSRWPQEEEEPMGLINAGGMTPMTFRSGNEGFKFYLYAADIEDFLKANPDEKYISGLAVANTRDKGPDYNLSIFDNKDDQRGGGGGRGRDQQQDERPNQRQVPEPAQDPFGGEPEPSRARQAVPSGRDRGTRTSSEPSGNRRSSSGGRGQRGRR